MNRLVIRRSAAVVAVATLGVAGAATDAYAAKASTTLSIRASHTNVAPKSKDTISGVLRSSGKTLAGKAVTLESRKFGAKAWSAVGTSPTSSKGGVSFTVTPATAPSRVQYMLMFKGDTSYAASHSAVVTITVKYPTSLSIGVAHTTVKAGAKDSVHGVLRSGKRGLGAQKVWLYERKAGTTKWTAVTSKATATTGTVGSVSFTVTPPKGKEQYELVFKATAAYFGSHSGAVTVTAS